MLRKSLAILLATVCGVVWVGVPAVSAEGQRPQAQARRAQPRSAPPRRAAPVRRVVPPRYHAFPRAYHFPPVSLRVGFYYHPYFGFYQGPYYGPFYPYPGPYYGPDLYSRSAIRTKVKPVETEVYINGYYAGVVDDFDGVFQRLYVPAGDHEIVLRLDGHQTLRQPIYVGPGDTFEIEHVMRPLGSGEAMDPPPEPSQVPDAWADAPPTSPDGLPASPFAALALRVEPADAKILIDGEVWVMQGLGELVVHVAAGWHQIEVEKDGFQRFATEIELSEGDSTRLNVRLIPN